MLPMPKIPITNGIATMIAAVRYGIICHTE